MMRILLVPIGDFEHFLMPSDRLDSIANKSVMAVERFNWTHTPYKFQDGAIADLVGCVN